MRIKLSATGCFRSCVPGSASRTEMDLADGTKAGELINQLNLGQLAIVAINGEIADRDTELHEGDRIELLAPIAGGDAGQE